MHSGMSLMPGRGAGNGVPVHLIFLKKKYIFETWFCGNSRLNFLTSPAEHAQEPVRRREAVPSVEEVSGLRLAQAVISREVVVVLKGKKTLKSEVKSNIFFFIFLACILAKTPGEQKVSSAGRSILPRCL